MEIRVNAVVVGDDFNAGNGRSLDRILKSLVLIGQRKITLFGQLMEEIIIGVELLVASLFGSSPMPVAVRIITLIPAAWT